MMVISRILSLAFIFLTVDVWIHFFKTGCFRTQIGRQDRIWQHGFGGESGVCGGMALPLTIVVSSAALMVTYYLWKVKRKKP